MIQFSKQYGNKKSTNLVIVLAFVLLSIGTAFGQTAVENNMVQTTNIENNTIVNTSTEMSTIRQEATSTDANMNFVLWFMGSKQDPNAKALPAGVNYKKTIYDFRDGSKSFVN